MEVGRGGLGAGPRDDPQIGALAAVGNEVGPPLAVAAVEQQHRLTLGLAQDGEQVIGLRPLQRQDAPLRQIRLDEQARRGEVVEGHAGLLAWRPGAVNLRG